MNPASRRVRDAAEHLLSVVMEQVAKKKYRGANDRRRKSWTKELNVVFTGVFVWGGVAIL